ncbi:MAG: hypothetical protein OXU98_00555, partial [Gammaproteobacteria bacterium]|nr:hypothetical protein [Gammaproteobacteria bacterium]
MLVKMRETAPRAQQATGAAHGENLGWKTQYSTTPPGIAAKVALLNCTAKGRHHAVDSPLAMCVVGLFAGGAAGRLRAGFFVILPT